MVLGPCVAIGLETGTYVVITLVMVIVPVIVDVEVVEMLVSVMVRTFEGVEEGPVILAGTDPLPKKPVPEDFEPVPAIEGELFVPADDATAELPAIDTPVVKGALPDDNRAGTVLFVETD